MSSVTISLYVLLAAVYAILQVRINPQDFAGSQLVQNDKERILGRS